MEYATKIAAIRLQAARLAPYANVAIMSLQPVCKPGIKTMAVDKYWRLYYDPVVFERPDSQLVMVLLHEVVHLLFRHHARAPKLAEDDEKGWQMWNIATDYADNSQLEKMGIAIPDDMLHPAKDGFPVGESAEFYFRELLKEQDNDETPESGQQAAQDSAGSDDQSDEPNDSDDGDKAADDSQDAGSDGGDDDGDGQPSDGDDCSDDGEQPSEPSQAGDSGDGPGEDGDGDGTDGDGQADGSGDDSASDQVAEGSADGTCPDAELGQSGSCSDGRQRSWEDDPPSADGDDDETPAGMDEFDEQAILERTAQRMKDCGQEKGCWSSFIEDIMEPKLDPRRLLQKVVRRATDNLASGGDGRYSYRRPSRRQGQSGLIRPRAFQAVPRIAVIIDTSGSMGRRELAQALGLVSKVLSGLRLRDGIHVVCGDTTAHTAETIFDPKKIKLAGGGGTDMGAIVEHVAAEKPAYDLIIVATDGWTGWPKDKPKMPVVAVVTEGGLSSREYVPDWLDVVAL